MSETTQNPYEMLDEGSRIDLKVCIGAFMLFDKEQAVPIKRNAQPAPLTTKTDVAAMLPEFSDLEVYAEAREAAIEKATDGAPRHIS